MSLLNIAEKIVNQIFALIPRKLKVSQPQAIKIIAHRGDHLHYKENTLAAFQSCLDHKVYGIEFDVRWTADNIPIVLHDTDAGRVFNRPEIIPSNLTVAELKKTFPEIPTLAEVIQAFGKTLHFMIELKTPVVKTDFDKKTKCLKMILSSLDAGKDYHIMSLHPDNFLLAPFVDKRHWLSIAETNTEKTLQWTVKNKIGGMTGHFLLMNQKTRATLQKKRIQFGTGFIDNKNTLIREINLGSQWHFSNRPLSLAQAFNDNKSFDLAELVHAISEDPSVKAPLLQILKQPASTRKTALKNLIAEIKKQGAPDKLVHCLQLMYKPEMASQALQALEVKRS